MLTFFPENCDYAYSPEEQQTLAYVQDMPDPHDTELDVSRTMKWNQENPVVPEDGFTDKIFSFFTGKPTPIQAYNEKQNAFLSANLVRF